MIQLKSNFMLIAKLKRNLVHFVRYLLIISTLVMFIIGASFCYGNLANLCCQYPLLNQIVWVWSLAFLMGWGIMEWFGSIFVLSNFEDDFVVGGIGLDQILVWIWFPWKQNEKWILGVK